MKTTLKILKAISDQNRLRIVASLLNVDELCACQITELLQISGAAVSRHLSLLTDAGILTSRKNGRWIYFSLTRTFKHDDLIQWLQKNTGNSNQVQADGVSLMAITACDPEDICRKQRGEACCPKKEH